jgi:hypothetical protein
MRHLSRVSRRRNDFGRLEFEPHRHLPYLRQISIWCIVDKTALRCLKGESTTMATRKKSAKKTSSGSGPKSKRIVRKKMKKTMHEFKHHELESGRGGKVKNPKQAIAIGLSEARRSGADIPPNPRKKKSASKSASKRSGRKTAAKKSTHRSGAKKSTAKRSSSSRPSSKRSTAKRSSSTKSTAKRSGSKRSGAKRSSARKSSRR